MHQQTDRAKKTMLHKKTSFVLFYGFILALFGVEIWPV